MRNLQEEDSKLVERYALTGCEEAFGSLVEKYARMALGVATRKTGNRQLAEEVAQNVFAILARKARRVRGHSSISGWIHKTACLEAAYAMRREYTRMRKMRELHELERRSLGDEPPDTELIEDAIPALDNALADLPASERDIVLQHYFERKTYREIGEATGSTEEAIRKRVCRTIAKLEKIMHRRGVRLSSGAVAGALGVSLRGEASASVVTSLTRGALAAASSIPLTTLITNTLATMAYTQLKTAAVIITLAAVPIALQWMENRRLQHTLKQESTERPEREVVSMPGSFRSTDDLERQIRDLKSENRRLRVEGGNPGGQASWDESEFIRIQKRHLGSINTSAISEGLGVTESIGALLMMTPEESKSIETGLRQSRAKLWELEKSLVSVVDNSDEKQVYEIPEFKEEGLQIREKLEQLIRQVLGDGRADYFLAKLKDNHLGAFSSFGEAHRTITFEPTVHGDLELYHIKERSVSGEEGNQRTRSRSTTSKEIPDAYKHLFIEERGD